MFGGTAPAVAIVFVALAVVFAAVAVQNFLSEEGKLTPARKTWLRISFIFAGIAVGLFVWHTFFA